MQPLEYKNIAGEEHLTFHSIRRLVHKELSELSAREAQKHVDSCTRCQGIYTSLTSPDQVIESRGHKYVVRPMIMGLLLVVLLVGRWKK